METIRNRYGEYQRYKGSIWMTQQDTTRYTQGTVFAIIRKKYTKYEFLLLGYATRVGKFWLNDKEEYFTLEDIVWIIMKSFGWTDEVCHELLNQNQ